MISDIEHFATEAGSAAVAAAAAGLDAAGLVAGVVGRFGM